MRGLPRTLTTRMVLLLGFALLLAQLASFALVWQDRQELNRARNEAPALTRFAEAASDLAAADPSFRELVLQDRSRRGVRFALTAKPSIAEAARDGDLERRATRALDDAGLENAEIRAVRQTPAASDKSPGRPVLTIAMRLKDGSWVEGRLRVPPQDPQLLIRLGIATALLFLFVLGAAAWGTRSINRPLRDLTEAARQFAGRSSTAQLSPRGPDDVREAMEAFNAMNARIVSLLEEKDYLLGAIGHDLRTPLASLRLRIESMEPEEERDAAVAKIEEMAKMLDDILVLARNVRADDRRIDLTALVEALADEYSERDKPLAITPSPRVIAQVAPDLLRRALRNLIDNALIYGGSARIAVLRQGNFAVIEIADQGPGIPADERERMLRPFQRLEASRNRHTGGTGLGLAIARGIAENHGGRLELAPNRPSGLVVRLLLPVPPRSG